MIVADTVRQEQEAAIQTAPLIEETVSHILSVHDQLTEHDFYSRLVSPARTEELEVLADSKEAEDFEKEVQELSEDSLIGDIRLYMDIPNTEPLFSKSVLGGVLDPMNLVRRTYWYGIFAGEPSTGKLFCLSFYLGTYEKNAYGDLAYITRGRMIYEGEWATFYLVIYFSQE